MDDLFKVHYDDAKDWEFDPHAETEVSYQQRWIKSQHAIKGNLVAHLKNGRHQMVRHPAKRQRTE